MAGIASRGGGGRWSFRRRLRASIVPMSVISGAAATTLRIRERDESIRRFNSFTVLENVGCSSSSPFFDDAEHMNIRAYEKVQSARDVNAADVVESVTEYNNNDGRHDSRGEGASVIFPSFCVALSFVLGFSFASYLMPTSTTPTATMETEKAEIIEATKTLTVPTLTPALAPALAPSPVCDDVDERGGGGGGGGGEEVTSSTELMEMASRCARLSRELRILKADPSELGVFTFRQLMALNDKQEMYSNRVKDEMINRAKVLSPSSSRTVTPYTSSSPTSSRASSVTSPTNDTDNMNLHLPSSSSSSTPTKT